MKFRPLLIAIATVIALIALPGPNARADVLVSNLAEPYRADTPIGNPEYWGAQSFYPGVNGYELASIDAIVGNGVNFPLVIAEMRSSDINGEIDNSAAGLITTFTAPDMSGATTIRSFFPAATVNLNATEKYWFILGSGNGGTYDWSYANSSLYTGPGSLSNYADSSDGGATWDHRDIDFPYFLQVNGFASVPEPSSMFVCAAAAAGMACVRRRRR